jgi:hypothetical protein
MRFTTATRIVAAATTLLAGSGAFAQMGPPLAPQYDVVSAVRAGYFWDPGHWRWAPGHWVR